MTGQSPSTHALVIWNRTCGAAVPTVSVPNVPEPSQSWSSVSESWPVSFPKSMPSAALTTIGPFAIGSTSVVPPNRFCSAPDFGRSTVMVSVLKLNAPAASWTSGKSDGTLIRESAGVASANGVPLIAKPRPMYETVRVGRLLAVNSKTSFVGFAPVTAYCKCVGVTADSP